MRSEPPRSRGRSADSPGDRRGVDRGPRRSALVVSAASAASALVPALVVLGALVVTSWLARPSLALGPVALLGGRTWEPATGTFGALPLLLGTAITTLIAVVLATPVALGASLFLSEVAPRRGRFALDAAVDLVHAIPSVVWGLFALDVVLPALAAHVLPRLYGARADEMSPGGFGLLSGGIVLAAMIVPTIAAVAREIVRAVPAGEREAAIALGATRWEVVRLVVLPAVRAGLGGAVLLGLGRALGEATVMSMVLGARVAVPDGVASPGATGSSLLLDQFAEAVEPPHVAALAHVALALLLASLAAHVTARLLVARATTPRSPGRRR